MKKYLLLMLIITLISPLTRAEIKSPNYDFNLGIIEPFFPGKAVPDISKDKTIKSDIFEDDGASKVLRFKMKRANYTLDIYTQVKKDQIVDVFVRLPQYFSHDQLLSELQKKYKKQDKYVRKDLSALYTWLNRDNFNILYHGSCSITCFPMFIEIVSTDKTVTPLYQKMNEALPK